MDLGIKDKVGLVLASSQGLGKSVAHGLAREGAKVIICGRNETTLSAAAAEIGEETGAEVHPIQCDLSVAEERENLVDSALEKWGRIDILVTNTGGPPPGQFEEFDLDDWEAVFNQLFLSAADGITVNNIMPGFTLTERLKQLVEKNPDFGKVEEAIPMGRFGTPEEFAAAAVFLVSEPASYITGVSLPVDGGWIKGT